MITEQRLKEIEERLKNATPGPWEMRYLFGSKDLPVSIVHGDKSETVFEWSESSTSSCADVELIAHAPSDLAYLLSLVEEMNK